MKEEAGLEKLILLRPLLSSVPISPSLLSGWSLYGVFPSLLHLPKRLSSKAPLLALGSENSEASFWGALAPLMRGGDAFWTYFSLHDVRLCKWGQIGLLLESQTSQASKE